MARDVEATPQLPSREAVDATHADLAAAAGPAGRLIDSSVGPGRDGCRSGAGRVSVQAPRVVRVSTTTRRTTQSLSLPQARRVTLAAQGFLDTRHTTPTMRTLARTVERTGVLQIDSVNVLARAHLMPLFSRMGGYDPDLLRRAAEQRPRRLVEYWAHVAAYMPVDLWPSMQARMSRNRAQSEIAVQQPELLRSLLEEVRQRGPSTARDLDDGLSRERVEWGWNWSGTQRALFHLFLVGDLAVAGRNSAFERVLDLPERVLPPEVLAAPTPTDDEAHLELVRRAARSFGVASELCLRDYYRLPAAAVKPALRTLVETGELQPVEVQGWEKPAYLHHQARVPRRVQARTLLSPFDPVVWERARTEKLFGFHYRIEIYVPEHLRKHGYYVLPFLLGDELVARVDLKADRQAGVLLVKAAHREPGAAKDTAAELAAHLGEVARWLGLEAVVVAERGDLAPELASAVADD